MKKFKLILGGISTFIGFVMFLYGQTTIATNSRYTWTKPFTEFEAQTLIVKNIGICLLVCGILDLLLVAFSAYYTSKTTKDSNDIGVIAKKCPSCGLSVHHLTKICPKCKTEIK